MESNPADLKGQLLRLRSANLTGCIATSPILRKGVLMRSDRPIPNRF